jgi:hypothetical protein
MIGTWLPTTSFSAGPALVGNMLDADAGHRLEQFA